MIYNTGFGALCFTQTLLLQSQSSKRPKISIILTISDKNQEIFSSYVYMKLMQSSDFLRLFGSIFKFPDIFRFSRFPIIYLFIKIHKTFTKNVAHQYGCWVKCNFVKTIYIQKVKREKGIYNKWLKTLYSESTARNLSSFMHISILLVFLEKTSYLFQLINIISICKILQCYTL